MSGACHLFAFQCFDLRSQVLNPAGSVLDRCRRRALPDRYFCAGGIENGNALIGKLSAGDVSVGKLYTFDDRFIQDPDVVMFFHLVRYPAHHRDGLLFIRFLDLYYLEATSERGVLFKILFVLSPRRCGDRSQLAASERRF